MKLKVTFSKRSGKTLLFIMMLQFLPSYGTILNQSVLLYLHFYHDKKITRIYFILFYFIHAVYMIYTNQTKNSLCSCQKIKLLVKITLLNFTSFIISNINYMYINIMILDFRREYFNCFFFW